VIGQTPLPGLELPLPDRRAGAERHRPGDRCQRRDRRCRLHEPPLAGVHVNEVQGNPFQMDVNYRYTASPLLGTPQGLSVYFDGVRINQPFGDVVSWDLIPKAAIASMNLMPGPTRCSASTPWAARWPSRPRKGAPSGLDGAGHRRS
jgi:hypothetical protein